MTAAAKGVAGPARTPRALWLDVARGWAIIAMVVYHFAFDLTLFGHVDWPVASHPLWRGFAAAIASTFLFLTGVSLVYAHGTGMRWRPFWRRFAVIALAAAAVSVATYFAMPSPIYFGILHAIAAFSVLALAFLFAPVALTLVAAGAVLILPFVYRDPLFDAPVFYPVGLAPIPPLTFDYEPIFPWFAATLLGVASARVLGRSSMPAEAVPPWLGASAWLGRHSLAIYLIHQPVLFAVLLGINAAR
ncbi:MAG: heparan-alpha-glucosaminide N-acetyltransferase [Devosia sp.]